MTDPRIPDIRPRPARVRPLRRPSALLVLIALGAASMAGVAGRASAQDDLTADFTPVAPLGPVVEARPGAAAPLDLARCLELALAGNDSLLAERERRAELDGQKLQALATGLPTVDLVGDWTRRRDPSFALDPTFGGDGGGGLAVPPDADPWFGDWLAGFGSFIPAAPDIPASTFWTTRLTLNWEINPLKILGAVGAANLGIERQELMVRATEHATAERVVGAYHAILMMAEAVNALEAQAANQRELLELTKLRYQLGFATRLDTLQAAVALANLQPGLRTARQRVADAGANLNVVLGRDPDEPISVVNEQRIETDRIDRDAVLSLVGARPDLQAVERFVGMLDNQRRAQTADARPYLSLYGAYGYVGTEFDSQWDDGHEQWTASVALNVPIFNGLLTRGQVDQTRAEIRRTQIELRGYRRQAEVVALRLINDLETARRNLGAANLNLEQAEEALEESLLMYELGKAAYLTVLDAEANHLTARRNRIEARYQVLTVTASLKRAVGHSPAAALADVPGLVITDQERE
jgi:outer membrane protein TolC